MEKWYLTKEFGQLYKEIDLVYGNEPILFVCMDRNKRRYLCMTYESAAFNYVIAHIKTIDLINMLENKVTMEKTFRLADYIFYSEEGVNENSLSLDRYASHFFPADKLPEKAEYYELDFEWIVQYIKKLKAELNALEFEIPYKMPLAGTMQKRLTLMFHRIPQSSNFEGFVNTYKDYKTSYAFDNKKSKFNSSISLDNQAV